MIELIRLLKKSLVNWLHWTNNKMKRISIFYLRMTWTLRNFSGTRLHWISNISTWQSFENMISVNCMHWGLQGRRKWKSGVDLLLSSYLIRDSMRSIIIYDVRFTINRQWNQSLTGLWLIGWTQLRNDPWLTDDKVAIIEWTWDQSLIAIWMLGKLGSRDNPRLVDDTVTLIRWTWTCLYILIWMTVDIDEIPG